MEEKSESFSGESFEVRVDDIVDYVKASIESLKGLNRGPAEEELLVNLIGCIESYETKNRRDEEGAGH